VDSQSKEDTALDEHLRLEEAHTRLAERMEESHRLLSEAQRHTEERLNALILTVDDIIRGRRPQ
jgi:hypothetical protein